MVCPNTRSVAGANVIFRCQHANHCAFFHRLQYLGKEQRELVTNSECILV